MKTLHRSDTKFTRDKGSFTIGNKISFEEKIEKLKAIKAERDSKQLLLEKSLEESKPSMESRLPTLVLSPKRSSLRHFIVNNARESEIDNSK